MTEQIHTEGELAPTSNPFSPTYERQIKPFREHNNRPVILGRSPTYNLQENIASPDLGKRARLLKANI